MNLAPSISLASTSVAGVHADFRKLERAAIRGVGGEIIVFARGEIPLAQKAVEGNDLILAEIEVVGVGRAGCQCGDEQSA